MPGPTHSSRGACATQCMLLGHSRPAGLWWHTCMPGLRLHLGGRRLWAQQGGVVQHKAAWVQGPLCLLLHPTTLDLTGNEQERGNSLCSCSGPQMHNAWSLARPDGACAPHEPGCKKPCRHKHCGFW